MNIGDFMLGGFCTAFLIGMGATLHANIVDQRQQKELARQLQRENDRLDKIVAQAEGVVR